MSARRTFGGDKDGQCLGMTTLRPSCGDCLVTWEPSGRLQACTGTGLRYQQIRQVYWKLVNIVNIHSDLLQVIKNMCPPLGWWKVKGSEVKGSGVKGSEVKGSEVKGSEVKGSEVKGSEVKVSEMKGSEL